MTQDMDNTLRPGDLVRVLSAFEENNMDKVIEYWMDRQQAILEKKHAEQTRLIIDKDINIITLRQALDDGAKVCRRFGAEFITNINYKKLYSDKTIAELRKDGAEYTEQRDKIRNTAVAAERLCSNCDTSEQRVQVLKTYGILNAEGVLDI